MDRRYPFSAATILLCGNKVLNGDRQSTVPKVQIAISPERWNSSFSGSIPSSPRLTGMPKRTIPGAARTIQATTRAEVIGIFIHCSIPIRRSVYARKNYDRISLLPWHKIFPALRLERISGSCPSLFRQNPNAAEKAQIQTKDQPQPKIAIFHLPGELVSSNYCET